MCRTWFPPSIRDAATTNSTSRSWIQTTGYYEDKALPSLPSSILNVMQAGRTTTQPMLTQPESTAEQMSLDFDYVA